MLNDIHGRSTDDIFYGHVSHNIPAADVFCITKFVYGVEKQDIELQAVLIGLLGDREEDWHAEEALAKLKKRKARHPGHICDLKKYALQFLREQESFGGGMTYTGFVNEKGKYISVGFVKSLDEEVGEDGEEFELHDLVSAPDQVEIHDWRKPEFCGAFEETLDILSRSTKEIASLFCITERHLNNLIRDNISNFKKIYRNFEVDEKLREKMVESLHNEIKAAVAAQNDRQKQGDLFVGEAI